VGIGMLAATAVWRASALSGNRKTKMWSRMCKDDNLNTAGKLSLDASEMRNEN